MFGFKAEKIVVAKKIIPTGSTADKILQLISSNESVTIVELTTYLKVSESTIERNLKKLKNEKRISREGTDKKGRWIVYNK